MKVVLQRVLEGSVNVEGKVVGQIKRGYVLLVGIGKDDNESVVEKMADKIVGLRINEDENGKMNLSIQDVKGDILSISQFTLYANCKKGRRPSFDEAGSPEEAKRLYEYFNECLKVQGMHVETGVFQADMKVSLINDGPVTIILNSAEL